MVWRQTTLILAFLISLLCVTSISFALSPPPRSIWRISDFSGSNLFNPVVFYINHEDTHDFPYEMGWRWNNVTLRFDLSQEQIRADLFNFEFSVPFKNYGTLEDPILTISAGNGNNLSIMVRNYTLDRLGTYTFVINSSVFKPGTENYINVYGVNINPIGYGTNPPNFQWSWISMVIFGNLTAPNITDIELLKRTEAGAAKYFYEQSLANGFVKDVTNTPWSSIAATGFGLTSFTIMAERYNTAPYWNYTPEELRTRTNLILDNFIDIQNKQKSDPNRYGVAGFFYHFIDSNGERQGTSEVSTVDTAILVAGALTAGEYFGGEVKEKAETIFNNVNWSYFYDSSKKQFSHGWSPETGVFAWTWDRPSDETMLVTLLAIASDPGNIEFQKGFYSWPRVVNSYGNYTLVNSYFGSAFTYEFAHVWFDFQALGYDSPSSSGSAAPPVNWWNNSVDAVLASRQFSIDNAASYKTYGENSWGLTACQRPSGVYEGLFGAKPCEYNNGNCYHDGTICPYGSISAMPLSDGVLNKNLAFKTLRHYYDNYYWDLWGEYGPRDSFNYYGNF
ncbi:MAG: hypothetical protein HZB67_04520, partial [Candidatus Aenigmarchaeota archaeon]|nr:hypothetical protein [Candidatus Aenigmarchaeota archaeon]